MKRFQATKKAPGKGGHRLAPFYPSTHPWGMRSDLDQSADTRWLKGLVCASCGQAQRASSEKWRVVTLKKHDVQPNIS